MFIISFVYLGKKESEFYFFRKKGILCFFFFSFLGQQGVCPRSYISLGAMRKSNLHSSLGRKQFVCCVDFFLKDLF